MKERNEIRPSIARAVRESADEKQITVAQVGHRDNIGIERPKVYYIPYEHAAVVWLVFLGESEHEAYDCRHDDGKAAAAELITKFIQTQIENDANDPVPVDIDGPEADVDAIVSELVVNPAFYEISRQ